MKTFNEAVEAFRQRLVEETEEDHCGASNEAAEMCRERARELLAWLEEYAK